MRVPTALGALVLAASVCGRFLPGGEGGEALGLIVEAVPGPVPLSGGEPTFGPAGARFTFVEFVDFECPHCARMAPALHELVAQNPDSRLIHRNYPLSSECNPNIPTAMHANVCGAVVAAACAREQGRFWEMQATLFEHYTSLTPEEVVDYAAGLGLDAAAFSACTARTKAADVARADVEAGVALQLLGTPAIYLWGAYPDRWVLLDAGPGDMGQISALLQAARTGAPLPEVKPLPAAEPAPEGAP